MISYLNQEDREQTLLLTLGIGIAEELIKKDKFKVARKHLKTGRYFLYRAWRDISGNLEKSDFKKLIRLQENHKVILQAKTHPTKDQAIVNLEDLYDLAEAAMGNACVGCQKHDWKTCSLRDKLEAINIPAAQEMISDCEYRQ